MKIYDCSLFRNELELLEIRLQELYDHVDHFVIVEATHTFQGDVKDLVLKNNWDRFAAWHDKMIYVTVDDMPNAGNAWHNEHHHRNSILKGLTEANDNDIIIVGDADEILRGSIVDDMRANPREIYGFRVPYFNFKFNYMLIDNEESYCTWTVAGRKHHLGQPEDFRNKRFGLNRLGYEYDDTQIKMYEHAGWHFTYLGDTDWVRSKIKSFAHTELNSSDVLDAIDVDSMIEKGVGFNPRDPRPFVKVALDDYFPKAILDNQNKYSAFIVHGELDSIKEYFPDDE